MYQVLKGVKQEAGEEDLGPYYRSLLLSQFNPYTIVQGTAQQFGHLAILVRYQGKLPAPETFRPQVAYRLPFKGNWQVASGDVTKANSHSWSILTQRYAYDFLITNERENSHTGDGQQLEDYYCYGQEILAPADGRVWKARDGIPEHQHPGDLSIDWKTRDFRGNFIVLQHAEKEYSFLAHFQPGSLQVEEGDTVRAGQLLGRCGNSGHSTEPHLHFHLQDHPNFFIAMGLPLTFEQLAVQKDGQPEPVVRRNAYLHKGEVVFHPC